jgi:hypothetical protein
VELQKEMDPQRPGNFMIKFKFAFLCLAVGMNLCGPSLATAGTLVITPKASPVPAVSQAEVAKKSIAAALARMRSYLYASTQAAQTCPSSELEPLNEILRRRLDFNLKDLELEYLELFKLNEELTSARIVIDRSAMLRRGSTSLLGGFALGSIFSSTEMTKILGSLIGMVLEEKAEAEINSQLGIDAVSTWPTSAGEWPLPLNADLNSALSARSNVIEGLRLLNSRRQILNEERAQAWGKIPAKNRWYSLGKDAEKSIVTAMDISVARIGFLLFEIEAELNWIQSLNQLCRSNP